MSNSDDFRQRWQDEHSVLSGDGNPMTLIEMADLGVVSVMECDIGALRNCDEAADSVFVGQQRTKAEDI